MSGEYDTKTAQNTCLHNEDTVCNSGFDKTPYLVKIIFTVVCPKIECAKRILQGINMTVDLCCCTISVC